MEYCLVEESFHHLIKYGEVNKVGNYSSLVTLLDLSKKPSYGDRSATNFNGIVNSADIALTRHIIRLLTQLRPSLCQISGRRANVDGL